MSNKRLRHNALAIRARVVADIANMDVAVCIDDVVVTRDRENRPWVVLADSLSERIENRPNIDLFLD